MFNDLKCNELYDVSAGGTTKDSYNAGKSDGEFLGNLVRSVAVQIIVKALSEIKPIKIPPVFL